MSQVAKDLGNLSWFHVYSPKIRHHVELRSNAIFGALVSLYRRVFLFHWDRLKYVGEYAHQCANYDKDPQTYAAAVYISAWFHDLYVSNRRACRLLPDQKGFMSYSLELVHQCVKYDKFLTLLSKQIRPTKVRCAQGETLFIPIITSKLDPNAKDGNYCGIDGWVCDDTCLFGIVQMLEDYKLLPLHPLPEAIYGRPAWLFDWHADGLAYTWFPIKGNCTIDDIAVAFVLGEACTPTLAFGDYDEWQEFPENKIPAVVKPSKCSRVRPVGYACSEVVKTVETRYWTPSEKMLQLMPIEEGNGERNRNQVASKGTCDVDPRIAQFRVVDWMYNACVINNTYEDCRVIFLDKILRC